MSTIARSRDYHAELLGGSLRRLPHLADRTHQIARCHDRSAKARESAVQIPHTGPHFGVWLSIHSDHQNSIRLIDLLKQPQAPRVRIASPPGRDDQPGRQSPGSVAHTPVQNSRRTPSKRLSNRKINKALLKPIAPSYIEPEGNPQIVAHPDAVSIHHVGQPDLT